MIAINHNGFDTASRLTRSQYQAMSGFGFKFAGRYLGPRSSSKSIIPTEYAALRAAGLYLLMIYETDPVDRSYFEHIRQGESAAYNARIWASQLGVKSEGMGSITFTVDYDVPEDDEHLIIDYFRQVYLALPREYRLGVYGSGRVCSIVYADMMNRYKYEPVLWLAKSVDWRPWGDGSIPPDSINHMYTVRQYDSLTLPLDGSDVEVDKNISNGDAGGV